MHRAEEEALEPAIRRWVERQTNGEVVRAQRHRRGAHRRAWFVDSKQGGGETAHLFLLLDAPGADGNARDAQVLRALATSAVPVPRVWAFDEVSGALLTDRAQGTSDYPEGTSDGEREAVAAHLMELLATLHRIQVQGLALPPLLDPGHKRYDAWAQLAPLQAEYSRTPAARDLLFDFALPWLRTNPPSAPADVSVVHGDAGPGNFLHAEGRITALVDWEIAHLGDPMEDLAALSVRDMATPIGDLPTRFHQYVAAGGCPISQPRLRYYRALVLVRNSLMIRLALAASDATTDVSVLTAFRLLLERAAMQALCAAARVDFPASAPAQWTERPELAELLDRQAATASGRSELAAAAGARGDPDWFVHLARRAQAACERDRSLMGSLADRFLQPLERG